MATHFHPLLNSFAVAQEANIPIWALIEHAAATAGMSGNGPQPFCNPQASPSSGRGRCPMAARPQEPQPCSSRQSQQRPLHHHRHQHQQAAAPNQGEGVVNFQDFIASAAAIAKQILGDQPSGSSGLSGQAGAPVTRKTGEVLSSTHSGEKGFEVTLDVSHFSPEELSVKIVENAIVIEAKHEEKEDGHGFVSRSFKRRYVLPEGVKAEAVTCKLASNGVLILSAPAIAPTNERSIPINFTGVPASVPIPEAPTAPETQVTEEQVETTDAGNTTGTGKEVPMSMEHEETKLD